MSPETKAPESAHWRVKNFYSISILSCDDSDLILSLCIHYVLIWILDFSWDKIIYMKSKNTFKRSQHFNFFPPISHIFQFSSNENPWLSVFCCDFFSRIVTKTLVSTTKPNVDIFSTLKLEWHATFLHLKIESRNICEIQNSEKWMLT